jgi:beta-glucosidase
LIAAVAGATPGRAPLSVRVCQEWRALFAGVRRKSFDPERATGGSSMAQQAHRRRLPRGARRVALLLAGVVLPACAQAQGAPAPANAWMAPGVVAEQQAAADDAAREAVAHRRARLLLGAMTLVQKMQQLTGSRPEILPELPNCYGARHVSGIAALAIPTFRISNGPVGVGQNDCVSPSAIDKNASGIFGANMAAAYTHPTSAKATALPSAIGVAASFDPAVAATYGEVIATELNDLALHVFEAPGLNLARLPILGRNFEYFGEDPYLTGVMGTAEIKAVQARGIIAMPKHYIANEQETNRQTIQETIDRQVLRELYLLPFEMAVKDGKVAAVMCAYNYVNGVSSCENKEMLTDVLRHDWGFTGYVQTDFFAMKSTVDPVVAHPAERRARQGRDHRGRDRPGAGAALRPDVQGRDFRPSAGPAADGRRGQWPQGA